MAVHRSPRVVFTDLDGTLLDHDSYDWQPAAAALARLGERAVPVCFVTSKTAAEVRVLRRDMGNGHPFAVENGAAVAVPRGYFDGDACDADTPVEITTLGAARDDLRSLAATLRRTTGCRFRGFSELDVDDIVSATGLDPASAARALDRSASEPLLWQDSEAARTDFAAAVEAAGYVCRTGGRFVHLGGRAHKGTALDWLRRRFETRHGRIVAISLGDRGNDIDLLAAADIGYWVEQSDGAYHTAAHDTIRHAKGVGPRGWAAAVDELIADDEL